MFEKEADEYAKKRRFKSIDVNDDVIMSQSKWLETLKQAFLAGAELREKRIEELEEKNRELNDNLCNVANNLLDSWCRNEEDYCPHLSKLEKENAELKEQIRLSNELEARDITTRFPC